ncbi:glycosyltransferase [Flavobacterium franklandianum]|uniref:Glycosyltransferase n=1 Tax=Flavobacterium franklandianum TaxID=2594430 RepID=A0A553CK95_9FLAO|nr:glycosyltransferase [Flavobacterium franklandianum]TRX20922.1 glycosyltransferase [Flavobacterium franklandianum]TRX23136.1 glycosyltransferase [Flavobacterium franklandianum]
MSNPTFSILITTKNRLTDLAFTLDKIQYLLDNKNVVCLICDDGSTDGTALYLQTNYPEIRLIQNPKSQGLIYSRNRLMGLVTTEFAISIDDDAHFLSENPLESIRNYFEDNKNCGLLGFRIFWGLEEPRSIISTEKPHQVQGFVGCAHVWRMQTWRDIPDYPAWFIFYGEENFASYQLFKKNWEIHYLAEVLVHHRVDIKARKQHKDYIERQRRSLRSGWYLFFLFYPYREIPRKMAYSLWMQFKLKVFQGDFKTLLAIGLALLDLVGNIPRIIKNSNRLTQKEYETYNALPETKLYWKPEK